MRKTPTLSHFQLPRAAVLALLPFLAGCENKDDNVLPIAIAASREVPIGETCVETVDPTNGEVIDADCDPSFYEIRVEETICEQIPLNSGAPPCGINNKIGVYVFEPHVADNLEVTVSFVGKHVLNVEGAPYTNIIYNEGDFTHPDDTLIIQPNQLYFPAE